MNCKYELESCRPQVYLQLMADLSQGEGESMT